MKKVRDSVMFRIFLLVGAVGWGVSVLGVLLPWRVMDAVLQNMGAVAPVADVQIRYWFRMAAGSWSVIGFLYLMVFLFPRKYRNLVPLLAVGTLAEGIVLLIHGLVLHVTPFPFYGDVGFCLIVGLGLLVTRPVIDAVQYPLLNGRVSDAGAWRFDDVDPAITAAWLEVIHDAFCPDLNGAREVFMLRPEDSLFDLYDSIYGGTGGADNMELESCWLAFDALCRFSGEKFDVKTPLGAQLRIIARCRKNLPPDEKECRKLHLTMELLPYLKAQWNEKREKPV